MRGYNFASFKALNIPCAAANTVLVIVQPWKPEPHTWLCSPRSKLLLKNNILTASIRR